MCLRFPRQNSLTQTTAFLLCDRSFSLLAILCALMTQNTLIQTIFVINQLIEDSVSSPATYSSSRNQQELDRMVALSGFGLSASIFSLLDMDAWNYITFGSLLKIPDTN